MPQATPQEKGDAEAALRKYETLVDSESRAGFLRMFQEKGPNNLKWAITFNASLTDLETTTKKLQDNYLSPGEILKANGRQMMEFETTEEAMSDVQYLVEKNQKQHNWSNDEFPPDVDNERPLYSKFYYIKDLGKSNEFSQIQKKEMSGASNLRTLKQIEGGMHFMEGLGFGGGSEGDAKIESVKYAQMAKEIEDLKSTHLAQPQPHM